MIDIRITLPYTMYIMHHQCQTCLLGCLTSIYDVPSKRNRCGNIPKNTYISMVLRMNKQAHPHFDMMLNRIITFNFLEHFLYTFYIYIYI